MSQPAAPPAPSSTPAAPAPPKSTPAAASAGAGAAESHANGAAAGEDDGDGGGSIDFSDLIPTHPNLAWYISLGEQGVDFAPPTLTAPFFTDKEYIATLQDYARTNPDLFTDLPSPGSPPSSEDEAERAPSPPPPPPRRRDNAEKDSATSESDEEADESKLEAMDEGADADEAASDDDVMDYTGGDGEDDDGGGGGGAGAEGTGKTPATRRRYGPTKSSVLKDAQEREKALKRAKPPPSANVFDPLPIPLPSPLNLGPHIDAGNAEPPPPITDDASTSSTLPFPPVPKAPLIPSLFDTLYSLPRPVTFTLRNESETESEDEDTLRRRGVRGVRVSLFAGQRYATPVDVSVFGWDWQASQAFASRASPDVSGGFQSADASLSFPAYVEPGLASNDGFDLPPVALPWSGLHVVSQEEREEERYRRQKRKNEEAKQLIPLEFRHRLHALQLQQHTQRTLASPAVSTPSRFPTSPSLPHLTSPRALSPSTSASMSNLLAQLDPPMPSKRWRAAWAQLIQQLPLPIPPWTEQRDSSSSSLLLPLPGSTFSTTASPSPSPTPDSSAPAPSPPPGSLSSSASPPSPTSTLTSSGSITSFSPPSLTFTSPRRVHAALLASMCLHELRRRAARSFRVMKDVSVSSARLSREMLLYWKKHDREVLDLKRKMEKDELEARKREMEVREADRQRKKLDFLLTQTELYSHFIGSKMGIVPHSSLIKTNALANPSSSADLDRAEKEVAVSDMTADAAAAARQFIEDKQRQTAAFDQEMAAKQNTAAPSPSPPAPSSIDLLNPSTMPEAASFYPCPDSFVGSLKSYQLRGMNWLINLYDQGINGILADEMGLGKTIQSIAFLSFLSSVRQLWGPFLIVCPNSTLHQWQQEVSKFCPALKVLPYWGSQPDRALLRKYWTPSALGASDSPFHVLVTSYHTIVTDVKYFHRLRWQYLLCDEAQSLKNAASQRWRALLHLKCRNRALLTGTPIQNSMAELWALLHFIMPEFFDSHQEFNEWFSREVEEQAEEEGGGAGKKKGGPKAKAVTNKSTFQSRQLGRLHMILKPFMLRRVKKDVENEMPPKIEILVDCPLSRRQRFYYKALTAKVRGGGGASGGKGGGGGAAGDTDKLMNIVMQFRKVCNHPALYHHRSILSPILFSHPHHFAVTRAHGLSSSLEVYSTAASPFASPIDFPLPRAVFDATSQPLRSALLHQRLSVFSPEHIHHSLWPSAMPDGFTEECLSSPFSFSRFCSLSAAELSFLLTADPLLLYLLHAVQRHRLEQCRIALFSSLSDLHREIRWPTSASFFPSLPSSSPSPFPSSIVLLCVTALAFPLASPSLPPPSPEAAGVRRCLRVPNALSGRMLVTSKTGRGDGQTEKQAAVDDSTIRQAMEHSDSLIDIQPFGLSTSQLHPGGDIDRLFGHHRQLLATLSVCLPRIAAPPIFPSIPGSASVSLRSRLGYDEYCGWEKSVLTGLNYIATSRASPIPLPSGVRIPASFDATHDVAPEAMAGTWHGISALSPLQMQRASASHSTSALRPACLPYTLLPAPLSPSSYLYPPRSFLVPSIFHLIADSGKLSRLDLLLRKLRADGHRVLIFSQMTRMLDLLGEFLLYRHYRHFRLDGQTSLADRRDLVRAFQHDPTVFAFILSTRAGGLGINLTSADTVIFFDCDWNPTQDAQAMDRSHRIGQHKPVTVYRLVCRHTVEERILTRAQVKYNIQKSVYAGGFKLQQEGTEDRAGGGGEGEEGEDAIAPSIDASTLFKSNELRELMLGDEEDDDGAGSGAGQPGGDRSRSRREQEDYDRDLNTVEHEQDLMDEELVGGGMQGGGGAGGAAGGAVGGAAVRPAKPMTKKQREQAERDVRKAERVALKEAKEEERLRKREEKEQKRREKHSAKEQAAQDKRDQRRSMQGKGGGGGGGAGDANGKQRSAAGASSQRDERSSEKKKKKKKPKPSKRQRNSDGGGGSSDDDSSPSSSSVSTGEGDRKRRKKKSEGGRGGGGGVTDSYRAESDRKKHKKRRRSEHSPPPPAAFPAGV